MPDAPASPPTNTDSGVVFAYRLNGRGGGERLTSADLANWQAGEALTWVHLDRRAPAVHRWLSERSGLDPLVCEALLADETRPHAIAHHDGMVLILRGVNLNPNSNPEDMVAIRIWLEPDRIITLRARRVMAMDDIRQLIDDGRGPINEGDFITTVLDRLTDRMEPALSALEGDIDACEDIVVDGVMDNSLTKKLAQLRRVVIALRRHLVPQRDMLSRLEIEMPAWLDERQMLRLRAAIDQLTRYIEQLDAARDHAVVTQDEINARLSFRMNRTMYLLSVVATVMLPLGLITGLLGINVGGIPGTDNVWSFWIVSLSLVAIAGAVVGMLRYLRWI